MTIARGDIHLLLIQYPKANVHELAVELEQFEQFHVNVFIDHWMGGQQVNPARKAGLALVGEGRV